MDQPTTCGQGLALHSELPAAADVMTRQKDLPMGRHDERALSDPALMVPFERFVAREEDLLELLQRDLERNRVMVGRR